MSKKVEQAMAFHDKGYNCAQAVACSFCEEFGIDQETMFRVSEGFGLGMGMMDMCGAVTGMLMVIGMENSVGNLDGKKPSKGDTYKKAKAYAQKFKEMEGSYYCRELKGVATGKPLVPCSQCIANAVELTEQYLASEKEFAILKKYVTLTRKSNNTKNKEETRNNTMAQLWGGRFTKETDKLVYNFNASISFDQKFYEQDIRGSKAHVAMLARQGILTAEEKDQIEAGLDGILADVRSGKLEITSEYEDIHSFVEANLIDRIGDAGKKLHTGRSRNDQVALDMKLYVRDEIDETDKLVKKLLEALQKIMEENVHTYMPGFTHLQKAQPVTLAHHVGAYFEMFVRDRSRLADIRKRMNTCPLGAGALAGTTYPLDREYTAQLLGFDGPTRNSMDSVSDRDYVIELLSAFSTIMMHMSRFCEEIIMWNSNEYRFVEIDDAYSTGSSIMPQKKNPDIAELVRGKTGRVYGALTSILTTMKGIPLAYNKDMQEDKELTFDAIDTVKGCLALFTGMISTMQFNKQNMEASAKNGFTNATDAADYLVNHGVPFRDAHGIVGRLVLTCIDKGISLDELPLEEYKAISPVFENDIYEAISMKTCVEKRMTIGAPGPDVMEKVIAENKKYLEEN